MVLATSSDFREYALRHYLFKSVYFEEFNTAIQLFSLINMSLKRFVPGKSPRVLVNQLIILFNTFEPEAACHMLLNKTDASMLPRLKSSLLTFEIWRDDICDFHIEHDHELMMALNNDLDDWRRLPCQRSK